MASAKQRRLNEYLRRNQLHAAAVGAHAGTCTALQRLCNQRSPPQWLLQALANIVDRAARVAHEMAAHRDELSPYRGTEQV